jgi:hypothetical protein
MAHTWSSKATDDDDDCSTLSLVDCDAMSSGLSQSTVSPGAHAPPGDSFFNVLAPTDINSVGLLYACSTSAFVGAFDARQHALLAESPGADAPQKMAWLRAHQPVAYRELAAAVRHANIVLSQSPAAKMATAGWRDDEWACAVNCQLVGPFPSFEAVSSFIASHSESIHAAFKWRVGGPETTLQLS